MIAPWAAAYIGIPFRTGGSARAGCDCFGLMALAYREVFGITLPLYADQYDSVRDADRLARIVETNLPTTPWREVPAASMTPGDGLLFRVVGQPIHVGIAVGDGRFLHVLSSMTESCIERLASPRWHRRLLGVYRYAR